MNICRFEIKVPMYPEHMRKNANLFCVLLTGVCLYRMNSCDARAVAVRVKILNFALCEAKTLTIAHSRAASVSELSQARVGGGGNRYVGW